MECHSEVRSIESNHYSEATWTSNNLQSQVTQLFVQQLVQANNKENLGTNFSEINKFEKVCCKMAAILFPPQCAKPQKTHIFIPLASTKLKGGYTGFTLSVCPSVERIVSALIFFHICTSYQTNSEGVSRVMFVSKLKKLKFWQIL